MPRRSLLLALLVLAGACRAAPDNNVGKACVANDKTVSLRACWLAGKEQGADEGAGVDGGGYDAGYTQCLDDHDTGSDEESGS